MSGLTRARSEGVRKVREALECVRNASLRAPAERRNAWPEKGGSILTSQTPMSQGQKNSRAGFAGSKLSLREARLSRWKPRGKKPNQVGYRAGWERARYSRGRSWGEGTLYAYREMPSTEIGCYRRGGHDPTRILLKPKGVREDLTEQNKGSGGSRSLSPARESAGTLPRGADASDKTLKWRQSQQTLGRKGEVSLPPIGHSVK